MTTSRQSIFAVVVIALAALGCQPSKSASATSRPAYPSSHEPMHRVEVTSAASAELAQSLVGKKCRVQLRRDALGMAGNSPSGIEGRWAAESSVEGIVVELTDQWIVIDATPTRRVVIPHASVLIIELTP